MKNKALKSIHDTTMSQLLIKANLEEISKEEFVAISQLAGGSYVLIYYR